MAWILFGEFEAASAYLCLKGCTTIHFNVCVPHHYMPLSDPKWLPSIIPAIHDFRSVIFISASFTEEGIEKTQANNRGIVRKEVELEVSDAGE